MTGVSRASGTETDPHISVIIVPEGENKRSSPKNVFEKIMATFSKYGKTKGTELQIQENE
jgi:hypothetical protein